MLSQDESLRCSFFLFKWLLLANTFLDIFRTRSFLSNYSGRKKPVGVCKQGLLSVIDLKVVRCLRLLYYNVLRQRNSVECDGIPNDQLLLKIQGKWAALKSIFPFLQILIVSTIGCCHRLYCSPFYRFFYIQASANTEYQLHKYCTSMMLFFQVPMILIYLSISSAEFYYMVLHFALLGAIGNYIAPMFVECGSVTHAQVVVCKLVTRNVRSWTSLLSSYMENGQTQTQHAPIPQTKVQTDKVHPSSYTSVALLNACPRLKDIETGQEIHDKMEKDCKEIISLTAL